MSPPSPPGFTPMLIINNVKAESPGSNISASELLLKVRKTIECKKKVPSSVFLHTYKICSYVNLPISFKYFIGFKIRKIFGVFSGNKGIVHKKKNMLISLVYFFSHLHFKICDPGAQNQS